MGYSHGHLFVLCISLVNKHKPWIETSYHGVITENNDTVILDPPLVALDKDAPVPFAGKMTGILICSQDSLWRPDVKPSQS